MWLGPRSVSWSEALPCPGTRPVPGPVPPAWRRWQPPHRRWAGSQLQRQRLAVEQPPLPALAGGAGSLLAAAVGWIQPIGCTTRAFYSTPPARQRLLGQPRGAEPGKSSPAGRGRGGAGPPRSGTRAPAAARAEVPRTCCPSSSPASWGRGPAAPGWDHSPCSQEPQDRAGAGGVSCRLTVGFLLLSQGDTAGSGPVSVLCTLM